MNTLRVKIALLLAAVIVSVVSLLSVVLFYLLGPPKREYSLTPVAEQVEMVLRLAHEGSGAVPFVRLPAPGRVYDGLTQKLRDTLAARGTNVAATIGRDGWRSPLTVSVPVTDKGWVLFSITDLPPPGVPWRGLVRWLLLITIGAIIIAVFVANRMVRPLVLLESAVESVGPDGVLPALPERGPAEVRATAKALNSLSLRLKRAIESRMRLVAAAGHDLRTPITRMRLRAEFVEDGEERERWLADLDELERIADSAILLVREESVKVPPELIELDQLVGSIGAELRKQNFDVTETGMAPVTVLANRLALNRALRNLIINAATHGLRGRVEVGQANGAARIVIEDDGPGLPPELPDQVFEPFFRADPARRQDIRGAGLGLTIAREIVQRAGGRIDIANRSDGGLRQVVELPRAESKPSGDGFLRAP
jgi:signal transduction histidine kinase